MSAFVQASKELVAVLEKFRTERSQIDAHIKALETLVGSLKGDAPVKRGPGRPKGSGKKPGRPPKIAAPAPEPKPAAPKPAARKRVAKPAAPAAKTQESNDERKKPNWSEESRRQAAERARKMWEARRKKKSQG